jgi:hypothetical protein
MRTDMILLKWILNKLELEGVEQIQHAQDGRYRGFCEHFDETSVFIKCVKFLGSISDRQYPKKTPHRVDSYINANFMTVPIKTLII